WAAHKAVSCHGSHPGTSNAAAAIRRTAWGTPNGSHRKTATAPPHGHTKHRRQARRTGRGAIALDAKLLLSNRGSASERFGAATVRERWRRSLAIATGEPFAQCLGFRLACGQRLATHRFGLGQRLLRDC